ncbi:MAG: FGGY-family carbohydrate kinase [Planctomycetota bacterium]
MRGHAAGKNIAFAPEELGIFVFYNLSAFGTPVKTTIVAAGMEFEAYTAVLKARWPGFAFPAFDEARYRRIVNERALFVTPTAAAGTGMFPKSAPRVVAGATVLPLAAIKADPRLLPDRPVAEDLYVALNLSLALQTRVALERAGARPGTAIYIEGGFRKNDAYGRLVAALFSGARVAYTGMTEATSFGAALLGKCAVEKRHPRDLAAAFDLAADPVTAAEVPGLTEYAAAFGDLVTA